MRKPRMSIEELKKATLSTILRDIIDRECLSFGYFTEERKIIEARLAEAIMFMEGSSFRRG